MGDSFILINPSDQEIQSFLVNKNYNYHNLIQINPKKEEYSINQIRELKNKVYYRYQKKIIYLLKNFDSSSIEAQNAFLKLFEEPPSNVFFILTAVNIHKLLPTIISRAKVIYFKKSKKKLSFKKNHPIFKWQTFLSKENALNYLNDLLVYFQKENTLLIKIRYKIIKEILKIRQLIENNNLNYQLALDYILIFTKKLFKIRE